MDNCVYMEQKNVFFFLSHWNETLYKSYSLVLIRIVNTCKIFFAFKSVFGN